jgi:hypothetical protein
MTTFPDAPRTFPGSNLGTKYSQKTVPGSLKGSGNVGTSCDRATFPGCSQTDDQPRQAQRRGLACLGRIVLARGNVGR